MLKMVLERFKRKSFKFKIMATYIIGLLIIGISGYGYFVYSQIHTLNIQLKQREKELIQQYKHMAITAVSVAENIIDVTQHLALEGKLTKQQAIKIALENLNTIKYPPAGYVWCIKEDGTILLDPPKPEIIGKNIFKLKKKPYTTLAKLIEGFRIQSGGFIKYEWFYPGIDNRVFEKISYVKDIPSLHWVIGSGFYLRDIKKHLESFKESQIKTLTNNILMSFIPGIISSLISIAIMYMLILKMMKSVEDVANIAGKLIEEDVSMSMTLPVITDGAIGKLIHNTNRYIEHLSKMIKFREDLELSETEEEIFYLIGDFMEKEFGIKNYNIYSVKDNTFNLVVKKGEVPCKWHNKCLKAAKKGIVIEEKCTEKERFICYPIISSQELMGVIELALDNDTLKTIKNTLNKFIQSSGHSINIRRLTKTLKELSLRDKLTELYNRRFLEEIIQTIASSAERQNSKVAIAMIDIDDFKKVNDTYGHSTGDEALKTVANILKKHFRRKSDLIVRYGGEEFLVILQDIDEKKLKEMLNEFKNDVEKAEVSVNGHKINLTVSVGYSIFPDDSSNVKQIIELADRALYEAKANGKNKVIRFKGGEKDG